MDYYLCDITNRDTIIELASSSDNSIFWMKSKIHDPFYYLTRFSFLDKSGVLIKPNKTISVIF